MGDSEAAGRPRSRLKGLVVDRGRWSDSREEVGGSKDEQGLESRTRVDRRAES